MYYKGNEEHHDVPMNQLESLSGLPLRPEEATPGTSVVWLYKKTPYEATIVDPPDQLYLTLSKLLQVCFQCMIETHACSFKQ